MYGTQTLLAPYIVTSLFENDVKSYECVPWFENDVKMYGTQTRFCYTLFALSLRMM